MRLFTYDYDHAVLPSQPTVDIEIRPTRGDRSIELKALVDSGADVTLIPQRHLQAINARSSDFINVTGMLGIQQRFDTYRIVLRLAAFATRLTVIAGHDPDLIVIGRDVLNYLRITLNGPATTTEILVED